MDRVIGYWIEKLQGGDIAINEVRVDATLSVLVLSSRMKQCLLYYGVVMKVPTQADIEFYFSKPEEIMNAIRECGICLA